MWSLTSQRKRRTCGPEDFQSSAKTDFSTQSAKSCPSLTIIIYVRNIFGLATREASHPSMMETSRATTSAVLPTADIVGHRGHVRKVPRTGLAQRTQFAFTLARKQRQTQHRARPSILWNSR